MIKHFFLFVAIIVPGYCLAQVSVSFSSGLAGFKMQDMKHHQSEIKAQFPTDVKIIESFPSFWFYELSITGEVIERLRIGGTIGFTSTGGHMNYRDYSGQINCDQLTTALTTAIRTEILLSSDEKWPFYFTNKLGVMFGHYDLDVLVEINGDKDSDKVSFESANIFIEPGFMLTKKIIGPLTANVNAGYNVNATKGKQKLVDNKDLFLQDNSGNRVNLDWSGFRLSVGLSVAF